MKSVVSDPAPTVVLATRITPRRASHSYSGVTFVVHAQARPVVVTAVRVGGDLGGVRCFASKVMRTPTPVPPRQWRDWVLVGAETLRPNWEAGAELPLAVPVPVPAGSARTLYVHSDMPGDRGIAYETYMTLLGPRSPFAMNADVHLYPGVGEVLRSVS